MKAKKKKAASTKTDAPALPPLPEKTSVIERYTFTVPHILKSITKDKNGFTHRDVREGGLKQLDFECVTEFSDKPVEETPFSVRVTNQLNFAGSVINVINDEIVLDDFRLVPTVPTAKQYLASVGKRVLVMFSCSPDAALTNQQGKQIYRIYRAFITLP
jgi:hypothetical protein